jgi:formylglycine-generating enzyme required for sulfatase activity
VIGNFCPAGCAAPTAGTPEAKAVEEARAKAEAGRQRLALLQQEVERLRAVEAQRAAEAEAERLRADAERRAEAEAKRKAEAARPDPALSVTPGSGKSFRDCPQCPEMVVVPAGSFMMGSPASENAGPQHRVTITRPFAVGKLEVTVGELETFVRESDRFVGDWCWTFEGGKLDYRSDRSFRHSGFVQHARHPAACVSWDDASAFVDWLSRKTGKSYRLLTEAEWEYVARAGTTTRYHFGDNERDSCTYGNVADQTVKKNKDWDKDWTIADCRDGHLHTAPAGSFRPNAFGLHDVHGNVWEWVRDCWNRSYSGAPSDGSARTTENCQSRVLRGGSWRDGPMGSALRYWASPHYRESGFGFRVARKLGAPAAGAPKADAAGSSKAAPKSKTQEQLFNEFIEWADKQKQRR